MVDIDKYKEDLKNAKKHGEPEDWPMPVSKEDLDKLLTAYESNKIFARLMSIR